MQRRRHREFFVIQRGVEHDEHVVDVVEKLASAQQRRVDGRSELPGSNEAARFGENPVARVRLSRHRSFRDPDQMAAIERRRSRGEQPVLESTQEEPNCDTKDSKHRV